MKHADESDKAELKKEREEREAFEDEATMKIKKLEHDNETLEAEIDAAKQEGRDFKPNWSSFLLYSFGTVCYIRNSLWWRVSTGDMFHTVYHRKA